MTDITINDITFSTNKDGVFVDEFGDRPTECEVARTRGNFSDCFGCCGELYDFGSVEIPPKSSAFNTKEDEL